MNPTEKIKYLSNERSLPKESRLTSNKFSEADLSQEKQRNPYSANYASSNDLRLLKSGNFGDSNSKSREDYYKTLNNRRKNESNMGTLKAELQNLKTQVNKLINKQTVIRTPKKQKTSYEQFRSGLSDERLEKSDRKISYGLSGEEDLDLDRNYQDQYENDISDTASVSSKASVTTENVLHEPLRKLERRNQNLDPDYYRKLENDLLKTEIKNLKNKYVSKKKEFKQKVELLEKKIEYLQISLEKSEGALLDCRKNLEMQMMTLKKQLQQKQNRLRQTDVKTHEVDINEPQKDTDSASSQYLKEKIKTLYAELSSKSSEINNLNEKIGNLQSSAEKGKFDLKKQLEKNNELSKQLEFNKRQQSRFKHYLQVELGKKKELAAENLKLQEKNKELINEIYAKEQIVVGSEQYENRLSEEIEQYKTRENELMSAQVKLSEANQKLETIKESQEEQIKYLKSSSEDTASRLSQMSKRLKDEQQKWIEKEDHYRSTIAENKKLEEQKLRILKEQLESQEFKNTEIMYKNAENQNQQINDLLREKDQQISKWKAEYKILKIKSSERLTSEARKREEIDEYYRGYTRYRHQNRTLQENVDLLTKTANQYLETIREMESQKERLQIQTKRREEEYEIEIRNLRQQLSAVEESISRANNQLSEAQIKLDQETKYREKIESKLSEVIKGYLESDQESEGDQNFQLQQPETEANQQIAAKKTHGNKKIKISEQERLQLESLNEAFASIKKRLVQQDQKTSKSVREIKNKDKQITELRKEIRQLLESHEKQLSQLKQKYMSEAVSLEIKNSLSAQKEATKLFAEQQELLKAKYEEILSENVLMKRKVSELEKQSLDLGQQTKSLTHLFNVKSIELQNHLQKHSRACEDYEKKIHELQIQKQEREIIFNNLSSVLKDEIAALRIDLKGITLINDKTQSGKTFDETLKNQIQANKELRVELQKKNEEIYRLRDNYTTLQSQFDNLRSEGEISKLKVISERKNQEVQYQIEAQNMKNQLAVEEKKLSSLEQKICLVIEQNKKKDTFIQSYIMGKKLPQKEKEFLSEFVKQYEIQLSGKFINEKLRADSHELEKMAVYNYNLLKDLAEIKERILLYESIDQEVISLYRSKDENWDQRMNDFDSAERSKDNSSSHGAGSPVTPNKTQKNKRYKKMFSLIDGGSLNNLDQVDDEFNEALGMSR